MSDEPRRRHWERHAEWPLTGLAVLFLAAYALPILRPDISPALRQVCEWTTWIAWAAFAVDFIVRLSLSARRGRFVRRNLLDLAVIALPLLRPLRLLRLVTLMSILDRQAGGSMRGRVAVYVAGATSLTIFVAGLAVLDAERRAPGSNIVNFGDALWWAMTTVTTVGYGDHFPVTATGRFIAGGLMLAGIALLGIVTASLASWLLEKVRDVGEQSQAATRRDLELLAAEVRALREMLEPDEDKAGAQGSANQARGTVTLSCSRPMISAWELGDPRLPNGPRVFHQRLRTSG